MDDQDRMSQASSTATISYFPVTKEGEGKVHAFGKRCQAAKRDPNCPVVIRGWLNKKDSRGLKLWKRRWFVLSNYCLFYYKDSREESVLGSIPLPSYKILFCTPHECKNQKFTFKVTHQGMRSYFFSADTQEDLLGWVRALSQSAAMESASSINRRCSSYQDFTRIDYGELVDFSKKTSDGIGHSQKQKHVSRTLTNLSQLTVGQTGASQWARERFHHRQRSQSDGTSPPPIFLRRTCGCNLEEGCLYDHSTPPSQREMIGAGFLSTKSQPESQAHAPMGRVDIRPNDDLDVLPQSLYYTFSSPKPEFKSAPTTPLSERWQNVTKTSPTYASVHYQSNGRKPLAKTSKHDLGELPTIRPYESDADTVLTRLCGCDKMLQALSAKLAQLQMDKESAQCALEVSRLQLHEWHERGLHAQEESLTHKSLLQEELVTIRARMCDVLLEMDWVWSQYERMESELCVIRSHLQHISNFGLGQEQTQAQKVLWIMEDILAALKVNRDHFYFLLVLQRPHVLQSTATHPGFTGQHTEMPGTGLTTDMEQTPPVRPALPQELQDSHQIWDYSHVLTESPNEGFYGSNDEPAQVRGRIQSHLHVVKPRRNTELNPGSRWNRQNTINQAIKMRMRQDEDKQNERIRTHPENLNTWKKPPLPTVCAQSRSSETEDKDPFPLRVTRVVSSVLPSSLMARRVSVEDPPAELDNPLSEKMSPETIHQTPSTKMMNSPQKSLLGSPVKNQTLMEAHCGQPIKRRSRQQCGGVLRSSKKQTNRRNMSGADTAELFRNQAQDPACLGNGSMSLDKMEEEQSLAFLTSNMELELTPEKRNAKLRRVEQIRERFLQSTGRGSFTTSRQVSLEGEPKVHQTLPNITGKNKVESEDENERSNTGFEKGEKDERTCSQPTYHGGASQDNNDRELIYPASPRQISSMTVYQKDEGKGFEHVEEISSKEDERCSFSSDLKAKWFLSTNDWQDAIPLLTDDLGSLCNDETTDVKQQPAYSDDATDSSELLSTVHESLEKMKENHSLFYKIACDISISDSDITKCDGTSNGQMSCMSKEEEELLITESDNATFNAECLSQQPVLPPHVNNNSNSETCYIKNEFKDNSEQSRQLEVNGTNLGGDADDSVQVTDDLKKDQKRSDLVKESNSFGESAESTVHELGTNKSFVSASSTVHGGKGVVHRDSFGKARVTILRTSL